MPNPETEEITLNNFLDDVSGLTWLNDPVTQLFISLLKETSAIHKEAYISLRVGDLERSVAQAAVQGKIFTLDEIISYIDKSVKDG